MPTKPILNFDGLYGDSSARTSAEYIHLEPIATRSQTYNWTIQPHIHSNLFQVFVMQKGVVTFQQATQQQTLEAPCVICIPPTKLHGLAFTPDVEGQILTVSEEVMEDIFQTSKPIWSFFEEISILANFEEYSFDKIQERVSNIGAELFGENLESPLMLRAYLTEFFISLFRLNKQAETPKGDSLMLTYFRKFQRGIRQAEYHKSIPEFAEELNITAVHLNRICKAVVGKSAIEVVHKHLISEAEKYLLHTSYSVSEIAYLLKFEYPNYFAKLFRKHTGVSPLEFRNGPKRSI